MTFKEDFRLNKLYTCMPLSCLWHVFLKLIIFLAVQSTTVVDLSSVIQFPFEANNTMISDIWMGDSAPGTQQGAMWWDGGDYIYKQGAPPQ